MAPPEERPHDPTLGPIIEPSALDFAEAIAGSREFILLHSGGNQFHERGPWPTVAPTVPWAVLLKDRDGRLATLGFDFDASRGDAAPDAEALAARLTALGIGHVVVRSGPSNGRHVLVSVRPHVPAGFAWKLGALLQAQYPSLDLSPLSGSPTAAIRPPGSPHRHGGRSTVLGDPTEALAALRRPNDPSLLLGFWDEGVRWREEILLAGPPNLRLVRERVGPKTWDLLLTGAKTRGDRSPSGVRWSALIRLIRAGFTFGEIVQVLLSDDLGISTKIRESAERHHRRDLRLHLHQEWIRAAPSVAANPPLGGPNEFRAELSRISDAAGSHHWKGQVGVIDHLVFEAMISIALKAGRQEITASHRQLAEAAKLNHHQSAGFGVKRLMEADWIKMIRRGRGPVPPTYRLQIPEVPPISTSPIGGSDFIGPTSGIVIRASLHDAFRWGSLAKSCVEILGVLDLVEGLTPKAIQATTGRSLGVVYGDLRRMESHGLVEKLPDRTWIRICEPDLDRVAEANGTKGRTEIQHQKHVAERDRYLRRRREILGDRQDVTDPETGEIRSVIFMGQGMPEPLFDAVVGLVHGVETWTGSATELYGQFARTGSGRWPSSVVALISLLERYRTALRLEGVDLTVEFGPGEDLVTLVSTKAVRLELDPDDTLEAAVAVSSIDRSEPEVVGE
jgi:hypothetical protein